MRLLISAFVVFTCLSFGAAPDASAQETQPTAAASSQVAVNLNTATVEQLETLPGIGQKMAELIIEYREKVGKFTKVEELMNVKGIGEKAFLKLKPLVVIEAPPSKGGGAR